MMVKKKLVGVGLATAMLLSVATGASAAETPTNKETPVKVNASSDGTGGLNLETSNAIDFNDIVLDKSVKSYTTGFEDSFTVTDLRGTHEGWELQVTADPLANENDWELNDKLTIKGLDSIEDNGDGVLPEQINDTKTLLNGEAVTVAKATEGQGMGQFDLTYPEDALELTVSAKDVKSGTYETTINWNLLNAPQ